MRSHKESPHCARIVSMALHMASSRTIVLPLPVRGEGYVVFRVVSGLKNL